LYYRLGIVEIHLVPLRQRREDIPYLTAAFVRDCAARLAKTITGVTAGAERVLQEQPWPGNIRELRNIIERACLLSDDRILTERDIIAAAGARPIGADVLVDRTTTASAAASPARGRLHIAQRAEIERTLQQANGNKAEAARMLGVSRRSLYRWLDRLDLRTRTSPPPG
jgi:DNA-binding NtrC family response regulator